MRRRGIDGSRQTAKNKCRFLAGCWSHPLGMTVVALASEGTRRQIGAENEWEAIGGIASRVPGVLSLRRGEPQRI